MLAVAFGFAALLASGMFGKLRGFGSFRSVVADYRLLPPTSVLPVAVAIPTVEGGLAALWLAAPWLSDVAAMAGAATATLMLVYSAAVAVNLLRGRAWIDCGCGGGEQLSWVLVGRNLVFATVALTPLAITEPSPPTALDFAVSVPLLAFAALLYFAFNALLANAAAMSTHRTASGPR